MPWCFALCRDGLHCGIDGTATLMTEHDNQAGPQNLHTVLDASQAFIVEHVARYSNDKQISEAFIKDDFGWHPRIGTTEDDRKRMLTLRQFCASFGPLVGSHAEGNRAGIFIAVDRHVLSFINRVMRMLRISRSETCIAFLQAGYRFGWRHDRLVRVNRVGGSGKLVAGTETCRDEQEREEFICHSILF